MADDVDFANERVRLETERAVAALLRPSCDVLEDHEACMECGSEIQPARRQALPGVELCVECARVAEVKRAGVRRG